MAGDAERRKVSGATAPFTAVQVGSFSPCWGEAGDVGTSFPVFLAAVNRWLLALVAADILTLAVGMAYVDILLRIADSGRQRAVGYQRWVIRFVSAGKRGRASTWLSRTTASLRGSWHSVPS